MTQFPYSFTVYASAGSGVGEKWTCKEEKLSPIDCCIPVAFNGPGKAYTPEGLFSLSVLNCIIAMFKVYCEKHQESFQSLEGSVNCSLDQDLTTNKLMISQLEISLKVTQASDKEKVHKILEDAIKDCPISNSIKSGKTFKIDVS